MMRAIVTGLVVAVLVAMLAVGAIGALSSSNPKPLQPVKVGRLVELRESSRGGLMSCANASQACPGPYEPVVSW